GSVLRGAGKMKWMNKSIALLVTGVAVSMSFGACANLSDDCEFLLTCTEGDGDGDGDGDTGGTGGGDGDETGGNGGEGGEANPGCDPACEGDTPVCNDE